MRTIFKNTFWIALNKIISILFPLLSYAYVSRTLGVDGIGKYNYVTSITSYFVLFAGMGISSYAIREGTKRRENKKELSQFVSEVFSLNVITTVVVLIIYICFLCVFHENLDTYISLFIICTVFIVDVPFEMEWIFSIYESFKYITIRSLIFRTIGLVAIFLFIRNEDDLITYTIILSLNAMAITLYNYIYAKKQVAIKFCIEWSKIKKHISQVLVMFITTITINLYTNSDLTILGFYCGDYEVGLYASAVKIYSIVDMLIASFALAAYPHIVSEKQKAFGNEKELMYSIEKIICFILFPIAAGLGLLSYEALYLISGSQYTDASIALSLLSIALIFNILNWFWTRCVILPQNMEKKMLLIAIIAGMTNLVLNLLIIPQWGKTGAAWTTICAEFITTIGYTIIGKKYVKKMDIKDFWYPIVGSLGIITTIILMKHYFKTIYVYLPLAIIGCGGAYIIGGFLLDKQMKEWFKKVKEIRRKNHENKSFT
ncbi:MAG: flippase [Lachnospiraceae bacterium]|nr:flippase [Lachnospiraceae bacterium]